MSTDAPRRRPTALDVARAAGVAPATAARVLGNYSSVSPAVRERVLEAARELGYRPNRLARSMVTGMTQTLGVVVANIEDQFFARLVRAMADEARAAGFELVLANSDQRVTEERSVVRLLMEKQVDGLVIAPAQDAPYEHLIEVRDAGMPLVLLDRDIPELRVDAVVIDGALASTEATDFLLGLGHRRIAIVTDDSDQASPGGPRLAGYVHSLRRAGVAIESELVRRAPASVAGARDETLALLDSGAAPTAIFATDNTMTLGVLEALQERGVAIPEEISLLGFDDLEWTKVTSPPLTVVSQPVHELGATAARSLLDRIAGKKLPPTTYVLPTTLVHRRSVAAR